MENKISLRKRFLQIRDSVPKDQLVAINSKIIQQILSLNQYKNSKTIALYTANGSEVDLKRLIINAITHKEVLIPVTNSHIEFYKFTTFEDLKPAKYGILEPVTRFHPSADPDFIIIPGIAFDNNRNRLGYGKGYYDKYLKNSKAFRVGVCFDCQIASSIPEESHDVRMDIVITEKRII